MAKRRDSSEGRKQEVEVLDFLVPFFIVENFPSTSWFSSLAGGIWRSSVRPPLVTSRISGILSSGPLDDDRGFPSETLPTAGFQELSTNSSITTWPEDFNNRKPEEIVDHYLRDFQFSGFRWNLLGLAWSSLEISHFHCIEISSRKTTKKSTSRQSFSND